MIPLIIEDNFTPAIEKYKEDHPPLTPEQIEEKLEIDRQRKFYNENFVEDRSVPNYIRQHVPNFVDIDRDQIKPEYFNTLEELLQCDCVIGWTGDGKLSLSPQTKYDEKGWAKDKYYHLMISRDNGRWWWVIGYVKHRGGLDELPDWKPVYD